ncbi:hypothetical protein [Klebsiella quasipneumoniae]|uniref:hypothetical protein n=1 Tax=Klebsiella quasipneumoniae TaxID=1463165 RepID=UPI0023E18829|nr:hypothetical protein [Klebsiella quasipneumoniae]
MTHIPYAMGYAQTGKVAMFLLITIKDIVIFPRMTAYINFVVPVANGTLTFPHQGLHVPSGSYFILPYNLNISGNTLAYATAQLLYQHDNTVFFMALDGIDAEFTWADGSSNKVRAGLDSTFKHQSEGISINVVTLTQQQAEQNLHSRTVLSTTKLLLRWDKLWVTKYRQANSDLSWFHWNGL